MKKLKLFNIRLSEEQKNNLTNLAENAKETKTEYVIKSIKLREYLESNKKLVNFENLNINFTEEEIELIKNIYLDLQ